MDIGNLLFNPNGRLPPSAFWRGYIILLAISIGLSLVQFLLGPSAVAALLGFLSLALVYPTICVFGKRLHDASRSAWWVLAIGLGYLIVGLVVFLFIALTFAGDLMQQMVETAGVVGGADTTSIQLEMQRRTFFPGTLANLGLSIGLGFIMASLRSDPNANEYGPPQTSRGVGDTFS